jgi:hypothetical protein
MAEMAKAMATGNPDALRLVKVDHDTQTYSMLERNWQTELSRNTRALEHEKIRVELNKSLIARYEKAIEQWKNAEDGEKITLGIDGETLDKDAIKDYLEAKPPLSSLAGKDVKGATSSAEKRPSARPPRTQANKRFRFPCSRGLARVKTVTRRKPWRPSRRWWA